MFGSALSLVMAQMQFSLMKKNKGWTSGTLANPPNPTSDNVSFLSYSPPPQSGRHMHIVPNEYGG